MSCRKEEHNYSQYGKKHAEREENVSQIQGEVVSTAVFLLNECPTKRLGTRTLEEVWFGRKPHVSYIRVFVSLCFRHVSAQIKRKLDDRLSI